MKRKNQTFLICAFTESFHDLFEVTAVFVSECVSVALPNAWKGKGPFLPEWQTDGRCRLCLIAAVVMELSMVDTPPVSVLGGSGYKYLRAVYLSQIFLYSSLPFCKQVGSLIFSLKDFLFIVSVKVG